MGTYSGGGGIAVAFYLSQGFGTGFRNRIQRTAVITKGKAKKADSGYNQKKRHYSGASKTTTMYYVRVNASDLDCGEETMDVEVSSSIYDNVVEGEHHEFTVVTDTLITGKKRVRIYY